MTARGKVAIGLRRWHARLMHAMALQGPVCPPFAPRIPHPRWLVPATLLVLVVSSGGCPRQPDKLTTLPVVTTDDPEAEADMRSAREAEEEGRLDEAKAAYGTFLEDHPDDPLAAVAELGLGRVLLAQGEEERARERFEAVVDHPDPSVAERARFYLGITLHLAGEHTEALEQLEPHVGKTVDPEDTALLLGTIAAAAIHVGDRVRAIEAYDQIATGTVPEEAREEAEERLATLVEESATPEDVRALYERLPQDGVAWRLVAVRAARQAYDDDDTERTKEILAALEEQDVSLDEDLREISVRVERKDEADPRVIGAILPLSGRGREIGKRALRGLMLGSDAPHRGPIPEDAPQLVFRDDGGDPESAARAVSDLVHLHQAIAIIGPIGSDAAAAAARKAQELGVPIITLSSGDGVTEAGPLAFRLFITPEGEARELVTAARGRGAERFAVLHPDNSFGKTMRDAFERQVRSQDGKLVATVEYEPGSTSFGKPIRKLQRKRFDALFVPDSAKTVQLIAPALAAAGMWSRPEGERAPEDGRAITLLLPSVGHSSDLVRDSGRYLQGALFSQPFNPTSSTGRSFAERYHTRFDARPDVFAAYAYDAFELVRSATEAGATTRETLGEALREGEDRSTVGASGGLTPERRPAQGTRVYELRSAKLVRVR
ncbi:MAG: ABC transporter substrate-binding protein [Myxococcota bacterium]